MIAQIFVVIELLLKLFGIWESFLSYSDQKRIADGQKNTQDRNDALDKEKNASTEDEFDKAQDGVVSHIPKP